MLLSTEELIEILSHSSDAIAVYNSPELHIQFVTDAMLKIWGKDKTVIGQTFEQAIPEIKGQPFSALLKSVWQTGKTYTATDTPAELKIDGKLKTSFFDFEYRAVKNAAGIVYAIIHQAKDVTERLESSSKITIKQQREDELIAELFATNNSFRTANQGLQDYNDHIKRLNLRLQESETDFRRLVEQAPVAIMVLRGENLVIDIVNQGMLEILGKDKSIIEHPLLEGMPELSGEPAVDLIFEVYKTGRIEDGIGVPVRMQRNGVFETRYFNFSYRPLIDNGKIVGGNGCSG
jgi:PAS domain-containing protein